MRSGLELDRVEVDWKKHARRQRGWPLVAGSDSLYSPSFGEPRSQVVRGLSDPRLLGDGRDRCTGTAWEAYR